MEELGERLMDKVVKLDERTWRAPTPWHAAVWLLRLSQLISQLGLDSAGTPVFRGQRDPSWEVIPSLSRIANQPAYQRALDRFCAALALFLLEELPDLDPQVHVATAQHYGLPTYFLDFTIDPVVAAYFACKGSTPGADAVVYWLPFNAALTLGARLILAPPWVRRLHRQRGFFVDLSSNAQVDIKKECYAVLFPAMPSYEEWILKGPEGEILPEDAWFERACNWALGDIEGSIARGGHALTDELRAKIGEPEWLYDAIIPSRLIDWLKTLVEVADWLALRYTGGSTGGRFVHDCIPLLILRRDNPGLVRAGLDVWEWMQQSPQLIKDKMVAHLFASFRKCERENEKRGGNWEVWSGRK